MCTLKVLAVSLVCNQVTRRPCFYHRICMRKESSSQRWETLLFLSACNMSAVTSVKSALAYAIRVNPIVMSAAV